MFLELHTSQNEEHTSLRILGMAPQPVDLGERVHHYLLLLLARRKLDDIGRGLEPDSCGWIMMDQLAKMLGIDGAYVNIMIHRVRTQLGAILGSDTPAPAIVERRRGEVRLGTCRFRISRGSRIEGEVIAG